MSATKKSRVPQLVTAFADLLCTAVAAAPVPIRLLPLAAKLFLRAFIQRLRLRIRGEKCAVCRAPVSLQNEFRLHPQAGWVCAECFDLYNHGGRALADAFLDYHGITREPLT